MSVAFPSGYNLPKTVDIPEDLLSELDVNDDGSSNIRALGTDAYAEISIHIPVLTQAEMTTLRTFVNTNKHEEITWTIDSINYIGHIIGPFRRVMVGNLFDVYFTYRAKEV